MATTLTSALVTVLSVIVLVHGRPTGPEEAVPASPGGERHEPLADLNKPVMLVGDVDFSLQRNAVRDKSMRWKDGLVPYVIDPAYPDTARSTILQALQEIESDVESNGTKCIQFFPRTNETSYLKIIRGTGCHSTIGYDPSADGTVSSTLGPGCEIKGVVMHEILHVLGFYHEQNRPDRDDYVDINETNVANMRDFFIRNDTVIDTLGAPYDFLSIMHYGAYNSGKDPRYPVTMPKPKYSRGAGRRLGQRIRMSDIDVWKLQTLYGCPVDTSHIQSDMKDQLIDSCEFDDGMCNFEQAVGSDATVKWVVRGQPTSDGPVAGFTNGLDPFLYASLENPTNESETRSSDATNETTDDYNTTNLLKTDSGLAEVTVPATLKTATIFTPLFTAPDDGVMCVEFFIFQAYTSYIDLYVSGPWIPRQLLRSHVNTRINHWGFDAVTVNLGGKWQYQLEFVANLLEGSVSLDDFYLVRGKCVFFA